MSSFFITLFSKTNLAPVFLRGAHGRQGFPHRDRGSAGLLFVSWAAGLICPLSAEFLIGYDFEQPESANRSFEPEIVADGMLAGPFKSSFADRPHFSSEPLGDGVGDNSGLPFDVDAGSDRSIAFRESEWGMNNTNTDADAINGKWYFEFTVQPDRHRRLNISELRFCAQIANAGKSADRWFLTSNLDGFLATRKIASGEITASSDNLDPAPDSEFQKVLIDLSGISRFQNISRPVTFRLYWVADNGNINNNNYNMTRIDKVALFGDLVDTTTLPQLTYRVADYGAAGNGVADDGPAIRAAFAAAAAQPNPAVVSFEPGAVYRFDRYNAEFNQIPIKFTQDLVVEGNGCTLLINPENRAFLVWRSRDVTIRGFDIDYDPLPFTQGEVLSVNEAAGSFVFQIQDGYPDIDPAGVEARIPDWDNAVFVYPESGLFTHDWLYPDHLVPVPGYPGRYTVEVVPEMVGKLAEINPGMLFVMKTHSDLLDGINREKADELGYFYSIGSFTVIARHSRYVQFEDVNLYAFSGRAWNVFDSDDVSMDRVGIMRKPGTDRAVSGVRGGVILKELRGGPVIRDSFFEATMDDTMNRSDTPCRIVSIDGEVLTLRFSGNKWGDAIIAPGDMIEFWERIDNRPLGTAQVLEIIRDSHRNHRLRVDSIPDGVLTEVESTVDEATLIYRVVEDKLHVSGCRFGTQLKKAIICRLPARVEDCSFHESNYGIHAYVTADDEEGPYPRNQEFINLRFHNVGIGAIVLFKPGVAGSVDNQNILIDGISVYQDGSAVDPANGVTISGTRGVTVRNSTIRFAADVDPGWELVRVVNSLDVILENNFLVDERLPATDSDNDGLPDWWEEAYFDSTSAVAGVDSDGDGQTNAQEYSAATNPVDPQSVFRTSAHFSASTGLTLSWSSEHGRIYTIQQSFDLTPGSWSSVTVPLNPDPPMNQCTLPVNGGQPHFFRVATQP